MSPPPTPVISIQLVNPSSTNFPSFTQNVFGIQCSVEPIYLQKVVCLPRPGANMRFAQPFASEIYLLCRLQFSFKQRHRDQFFLGNWLSRRSLPSLCEADEAVRLTQTCCLLSTERPPSSYFPCSLLPSFPHPFSAPFSQTSHLSHHIPTYRVTIQVVSNLPLTSKQKLRFNIRSFY